MKKDKFIHLAIVLYTQAIAYAKESKCNRLVLLKYLRNRYLDQGICKVAQRYDHVCERWIEKYIPTTSLWICTSPARLHTKREMAHALETRLAVLQKELKKCR